MTDEEYLEAMKDQSYKTLCKLMPKGFVDAHLEMRDPEFSAKCFGIYLNACEDGKKDILAAVDPDLIKQL